MYVKRTFLNGGRAEAPVAPPMAGPREGFLAKPKAFITEAGSTNGARIVLTRASHRGEGALSRFAGPKLRLAAAGFVLIAISLAFWPHIAPLQASSAMQSDTAIREELGVQAIMPLASGSKTGRQMVPTEAVTPLQNAPERPRINLTATFTKGDNLPAMLRRVGLSGQDLVAAIGMIDTVMPVTRIEPGTDIHLTLGRRPQQGAARPLDALSFRARFDLELKVARQGKNELGDAFGPLALQRRFIPVDDTPLRLQGTVGPSLYRSMRAAGVPASAVQEFVRALDSKIDLDRELRASDTFDVVLAYRRAATGERQAGKLLYAGIERDETPRTQLMRWGKDGRFYEASGVGEQREGLVAPVPGPISSRYGMRRHPILGYKRMHSGLDFRARRGTPIVAVTDGTVLSAGRAGGCGIAVKLRHDGGLETRYCHMSRKAVQKGSGVRRGQVIGYVGSTGLSTGPHLHYEMYRGGKSINPQSVKFTTRAVLEGQQLVEFKERLKALKQVEPGAALAAFTVPDATEEAPLREIEKVSLARAKP